MNEVFTDIFIDQQLLTNVIGISEVCKICQLPEDGCSLVVGATLAAGWRNPR